MKTPRIIRATIVTHYIFPESSGERGNEVLKEWFEDPRYPFDAHHAYRDGSKIGFSSHCLSYRELSEAESHNIGKKPPPTKDLNLTDTDWQDVSDVLHDGAGVSLTLDQCKQTFGDNIRVMCEIKLNGATDTEVRETVCDAFSKLLIGKKRPDDDTTVFTAELHTAAKIRGMKLV